MGDIKRYLLFLFVPKFGTAQYEVMKETIKTVILGKLLIFLRVLHII